MAQGNKIIVVAEPMGVFHEGKINGTPKPGTMMQVKAAAFTNGHPEYEVYAPGADGNQRQVLILLSFLDHVAAPPGKTAVDAYVDGDWGVMYTPRPGERMNVLFGNASGTADDVTIGMMLMADEGTGKFIPTSGSPESEPFQALEAYVDPAADKLILAVATGV